MDGIEHFDEQRNLNRVAAGFKGGPFYNNPVTVPARSFIDAPKEVAEKLQASSFPQPTPLDTWVTRYPNAKLK